MRVAGYHAVLGDLVTLIGSTRRAAARSVNAIMTATYFFVGRAIVEYEQRGATRAAYGGRLLEKLGADLSGRFGRGFSADNLETMRRFYVAYASEISETPSRKSIIKKSEILSRESVLGELAGPLAAPCRAEGRARC